jgi:3-hydroxyisobutyrate dehydrogenase-like beta-hydroxyacid dehydrogenase
MSDRTNMGGPTLRVGFLGLGRMGVHMAANIALAGHLTAVYNRTPSISAAFEQQTGVPAAASPAELAASVDILFSMVSDSAALEAIYEGPNGVVEGSHVGLLGVDMSTVGPTTIEHLNATMVAAGGHLIDAPVSGSTAAAKEASLLIVVGGAADAVATITPYLSLMGSPVLHVGPSGTGAILKLAMNAIVYGLNEAIAEALVLAETAGIDRKVAYDAFASSAAAAPFVHYRRSAFLHPERVSAAMPMSLATKDLRLVLELARRVGAAMPQCERTLGLLDRAVSEGYGDRDVTGVAESLREGVRGNAGSSQSSVPSTGHSEPLVGDVSVLRADRLLEEEAP